MSSVERPASKPRPVYLNLARIRQPLPAIVSILHRISGAVLFVGVPLLLAGTQASLGSSEAFESFRASMTTPFAKVVLLGMAWAFLHHFCAGLRYLLLDLLKFIDLKPARRSSAIVLIVSLTLTLVVAVRLW